MGESSGRREYDHLWKKIWSLPTQGKIKHLFWKALHNILPVKEVLYRRKIVADPICPVCLEESESFVHLVAHCKFAQFFWKSSPLQLDSGSIAGMDFCIWFANLLERWKGADGVDEIEAFVVVGVGEFGNVEMICNFLGTHGIRKGNLHCR